MENYPVAIRYLIRLLLAFAIIGALIITKQLLIPFVFSILLAYLLFPAAHWLEGKNIPRIATNFIVILSFMAFIVGTIYLMILLIVSVTDDLPQLREKFAENMDRLQYVIEGTIGVSKENQDSMVKSMSMDGEFVTDLIQAIKNTLIGLGLAPVYTFLLLFYRSKFRDFISMLVKEEHEENAQQIIDHASEVVPKYLKGLFVVCIILAGLNTLGFYIIGVKYALLLGLIAAIFNLIPYLGTVIGYGIVCLFVLITQSPALASLVLLQFFIVQFIENNILTPNITGSYVRINPLVIIFSLIAGGMIWGLPGMFMIIPILGLLKIVCENVESLKPIGFLLGTRGTEKYSITITSLRKRFGWNGE